MARLLPLKPHLLMAGLFLLTGGEVHAMSSKPRAYASLQQGDILTEVNGVAVKPGNTLELMREVRTNPNAKIKVVRAGKVIVLPREEK